MNIIKLINKKKNKQTLSQKEINFIIKGYTTGIIPDYQMSVFLMTIYFQSLSIKEISFLTEAMINSGEIYNLTDIPGFKVDKHSSGGVGDKISLIYAPLVASFGLKVAKISGRGLGQTGGTIDKLESIPGFKVELSFNEFKNIINKTNMSIIAQSNNIVPADKKIYALRDVTSTVDSLPLVAASIMCKKIATGSDGIVLDIKCGNGAFIKTKSNAKKLAQIMIKLGEKFNKKVSIEITNMSQPLGRTIGNAIEIYETLQTLQGKGSLDLIHIACESAALSLYQAKIFTNLSIAIKACKEKLKTKEPLNYFRSFVKEQGGDLSFIENNLSLKDILKTKNIIKIKTNKNGFMKIINTNELGLLANYLGAGRNKKNEKIDYHAGIYLNKKTGEKVIKNDTIMTLYTNNNIIVNSINKWTKKIFKIVTIKPKQKKLIYKIIK